MSNWKKKRSGEFPLSESEDACEGVGRESLEKEVVNKKRVEGGFPGGAVVENQTANAGDVGSSPGPGRSRMPQSN